MLRALGARKSVPLQLTPRHLYANTGSSAWLASSTASCWRSSSSTSSPALGGNLNKQAPHGSERLDFNDTAVAYRTRSAIELLRAYLVFSFCRPLIVRNADQLLALSRKLFGNTLTDAVVRQTFFKHFCGGEDAASIKPTVDKLASQGIGSILDYAAESDIESNSGRVPTSRSEDLRTIVCRTYTYEDEQQCDRNADIFKQAIRAVGHNGGSIPFAAVKVTALGPPELLQRVSRCLLEMRKFFSRVDLNNDGIIDREEWIKACTGLFNGTEEEFGAWFDEMRKSPAGAPDSLAIDYAEWLETLTLKELPMLLGRCKAKGPLAASQLEDGEMELLEAARRRAREISQEAKSHGVKLLVDAEHTYFQPAIDLLTLELMREFNTAGSPCTVFNTYQAYLQDAELRLTTDMERSRRLNYGFACKVVRGAYLEHEATYARKMGLEYPIHSTLEETHASYDHCVSKVMGRVSSGAELMVATHNQASVENAVQRMHELGLGAQDAVYFGQLYGMSDHLTNTLGGAGYRAYKYLPWGPVQEVTPYLLRRAQENSAVVGGAKVELRNLWQELKSRCGISRAAPATPSLAGPAH
mmetsp:Transcript_5158/g.12386  ORF Transcript_5158/g.12386 Transcript_5158/m.12386 type:complete len:584 (-) Transcript_5158:277-2028(-)